MLRISEYPNEGKYNIKSVSLRTGVQPVTLRAWERRFQILEPQRAGNGYRLYSEQDIALLNWLKTRVDSGIMISSVVADFRDSVNKGLWPEAIIQTSSPTPSMHSTMPASYFINQLFTSLTTHDETSASDIFEKALGSFPLLTLFETVISPVLVQIGEEWFNGKILIATEHFASSFFRSKLMAIYQSLPTFRNLTSIMVGGAPGELHEIGALMLSVLLREAGYRVEFLGPDLPLEDLAFYATEERPKLIILSATIKDSISNLARFEPLIQNIRPKPVFGFGGPAFNRHPELISQTPGIFLGRSYAQSLSTIQTILGVKKKGPLAS